VEIVLCNLYSFTKGQQAIRDITRAMIDKTGNLPLFPGIFPDYSAPIVRNSAAGRELTLARWGMPSPVCRRTRSLTTRRSRGVRWLISE